MRGDFIDQARRWEDVDREMARRCEENAASHCTLDPLVGACRTCAWARSKTDEGDLVAYDGGKQGWCGKPGQQYNFWNHDEPDMSKPVNDCWVSPNATGEGHGRRCTQEFTDTDSEKGGVVCVGKYRLWKLADDALLIEHESGERIEVSEREIERFYNSRF